ncbi:cache domain-containing sensor histidine kinase [Paenibacillus polymyxa]|uniref:cache domain-containing sensor histidine kinase n=1 Tax=Paenibacillus polymyxa TaxID=1406 RepID=UPI00129A4DF9|nr:sensor histidine kinase [Paenibacillus polymyxa]KAE8560634.1 two-component sensor histidine kinase [Paenibacillus polymyxa]MCJ1220638.1 sensor histidine kinase [Paenibacillus polymyxa]
MYRGVRHLMNNMRMRNKLLFSYVLIVMIPVLVVGGCVIFYLREQALDSAIAQTVNNVEKIKSQTANLLRVPTDISNGLMFDKRLKEMANRRYPGMVELMNAYHQYKDFNEYTQQYREVATIRFYSYNPTLVNNLEFIPVDANIERQPWFQEALKGTAINWFYIQDKEDNPVNRLSLVRQIPFPEYNSKGVLMIALSQTELNHMLSKEPFETLITDRNGIVVAATHPQSVGRTLTDLHLGFDVQRAGKGIYEAKINGTPSNIIVDELLPTSSVSGLTIISVFSTEHIVQGANRVSLIGALCVLAVLIMALILITIISWLITKRLQRLSYELGQVAAGDFHVVSSVEGRDEIGDLSRRFNYMVSSIRQLMAQVYETSEHNNKLELAQKDIKLKMMASQINPHFLFNALESIRMKAHLNGEAEIATTVRLLGRLMRRNLEIGSGKTTVLQELDMVRSYLQIQQFRFGNRLVYEVNLEESAKDMSIPPLIIQPLVENAVIHGLENKEEPVTVKVDITIEQRELHIKVADDGIGMEEEQLTRLLARITGTEEPEGSSIGLRNVHQRLTLMYGERYGLHIESALQVGTTVYFSIPREEASNV